MALRFGVLLACCAFTALSQSTSDCEKTPAAQQFFKEGAEKRAELERINGPGTNQKLAQELMAMRARDQEIRTKIFALPEAEQKKLYPDMDKIDAQTTARLKVV